MAYRRALIAIAMLTLALVAASCGGDDDGDQGTAAAQTETSAPTEANAGAGNEDGSSDREATEGSKKKARTSQPSGSGSRESDEAGGDSNGADESSSGGEEKPDAAGASPSSQFRKQARAVCSRSRRELLGEVGRYLKEQGSQSRSQDALLAVTRNVLIPSMEGQIAEIRSLEPPPSSTPGADAFLASWEEALKSAAQESEPLAGAKAKAVLAPVGRQARRAALGTCAYG